MHQFTNPPNKHEGSALDDWWWWWRSDHHHFVVDIIILLRLASSRYMRFGMECYDAVVDRVGHAPGRPKWSEPKKLQKSKILKRVKFFCIENSACIVYQPCVVCRLGRIARQGSASWSGGVGGWRKEGQILFLAWRICDLGPIGPIGEKNVVSMRRRYIIYLPTLSGSVRSESLMLLVTEYSILSISYCRLI